MTNDLLTASDEDLPRMLGEVLGSTPCHHTWEPNNTCVKCGFDDSNPHNGYDANCPIPDPIPLTPANAFKWRDWAVEKFGEDAFVNALIEVYNDTVNCITLMQFIAKSQPHVWLIASAICVQNDKEQK